MKFQVTYMMKPLSPDHKSGPQFTPHRNGKSYEAEGDTVEEAAAKAKAELPALMAENGYSDGLPFGQTADDVAYIFMTRADTDEEELGDSVDEMDFGAVMTLMMPTFIDYETLQKVSDV